MNNVGNRIKLEKSIINAAEQSLLPAIHHADPMSTDKVTITMTQLDDITIQEAREEQMMDALRRVESYTTLTEFDSGLSNRGKKTLVDIQIRAWQVLEPFTKPIPDNAVIMNLKPKTG